MTERGWRGIVKAIKDTLTRLDTCERCRRTGFLNGLWLCGRCSAEVAKNRA